MIDLSQVRSPLAEAEALRELWSPRVIAEFDDYYVKVAKVQGVFGWHAHADEDELFFILRGELELEFEQNKVSLGEGQTYVVPKGVRHNPMAACETLIMLIERKSTLHTGDTVTDKTRSIAEQLR